MPALLVHRGDFVLFLFCPAGPRCLGLHVQILGEISNKFPVKVGVAVLRQLVQDEPISDLSFGQNELQFGLDVIVILVSDLPAGKISTFPIYFLCTNFAVDETISDSTEHEGDESIAEVEDGDGAEEGVPKPQNQVDFLVYNVLS